MRDAIASVASGSTRDDLRAKKKEDASSKRAPKFSFVYKPKGGPFKLNLSFTKSRVDKSELIDALRGVIRQLDAGEISVHKKK